MDRIGPCGEAMWHPMLKWYWWRFNGHGYFWGMVSGLTAAMLIPPLFPGILQLYLFPVFLIISIAGCIYGTYMYPPTDEETLMNFYKNVRPWGFWKPIRDKVIAKYPDFKENNDFKRDMFNILIGVIAQTVLVILPFYIIVGQYIALSVSLVILVVCIVLLKKYWYENLKKIT
jgi:solute:Na+ symporter, SSS family